MTKRKTKKKETTPIESQTILIPGRGPNHKNEVDLPCGCVFSEIKENGERYFTMCPIHRAAHKSYAACMAVCALGNSSWDYEGSPAFTEDEYDEAYNKAVLVKELVKMSPLFDPPTGSIESMYLGVHGSFDAWFAKMVDNTQHIVLVYGPLPYHMRGIPLYEDMSFDLPLDMYDKPTQNALSSALDTLKLYLD